MKAEYDNGVTQTSIEGHASGSFHPENIKGKHVLIFVVIVGLILAFHFRNKLGAIHDRIRLNRRMRYQGLGQEFQDDVERGLNSDNFSVLSHNQGDSRPGLHEDKYVIEKMMKERNMTFDEARLALQRERFGENGIGDDGVPVDPKTVRLT